MDDNNTAHRLPTQEQTLATTAYEKPGERHDTDDERAGDDEDAEVLTMKLMMRRQKKK